MAVHDLTWDDQTWRLVWERTLTHAERHDIGMAVLRRRTPPDPFERRLAVELAGRWGRHAVWLAVLYLLWSLFWGLIGWHSVRVRGLPAAALPVVCTALGVLGIGLCLGFQRRMRAVTDMIGRGS